MRGINSLKFKLMTLEELTVCLDRLSRFKSPSESFLRVFSSILQKYLITPKYSKNEIENLEPKIFSQIVKEIWNKSVKNIFHDFDDNKSPFIAIKVLNNFYFKDIDEATKIFLNTNLIISPILDSIDENKAPVNLKFLIKVNQTIRNTSFTINDLIEIREKFSLKFPVQKLLIVEGITEEILLPVFADKLNHNLDKEGIFILGAGGKSKSPSLYLKLKEKLKIPVIILFDADAKEISDSLKQILLKKDKIIIINNGEFEDIISPNLIKRALNNEYLPASPFCSSDIKFSAKMCENIERFYRTRHLGEFKKSKLSKIIAKNIKYDTDVTDDIKNIIYSVI